MNPYDTIKEFEGVVAKYAGAPYGIAVDSCTNALLLACKYFNAKEVHLPKKTYVGVAFSVLHAGGKIIFDDYKWEGIYQLKPYPIYDSARRFKQRMYIPKSLYCLSFHWAKHIPIGRGGMILCDNKKATEWLKRARFDGRTEGVPPKEDVFDIPGYHFYMTPEQAARGLMLMNYIRDKKFKDIPEYEYPDLSKKLGRLLCST